MQKATVFSGNASTQIPTAICGTGSMLSLKQQPLKTKPHRYGIYQERDINTSVETVCPQSKRVGSRRRHRRNLLQLSRESVQPLPIGR